MIEWKRRLQEQLWSQAAEMRFSDSISLQRALALTEDVINLCSRRNVQLLRQELERIVLASPPIFVSIIKYQQQLTYSRRDPAARMAICLLYSDVLHYLSPFNRAIAEQTLSSGLAMLQQASVLEPLIDPLSISKTGHIQGSSRICTLVENNYSQSRRLVDIWHERKLIDDKSAVYIKEQLALTAATASAVWSAEEASRNMSNLDREYFPRTCVSTDIQPHVKNSSWSSYGHNSASKFQYDNAASVREPSSTKSHGTVPIKPYFEMPVGSMVAIMSRELWLQNQYRPIDPQAVKPVQISAEDRERLTPIVDNLTRQWTFSDDDQCLIDYEGWDQETWRERTLREALVAISDTEDDVDRERNESGTFHGSLDRRFAPPPELQ